MQTHFQVSLSIIKYKILIYTYNTIYKRSFLDSLTQMSCPGNTWRMYFLLSRIWLACENLDNMKLVLSSSVHSTNMIIHVQENRIFSSFSRLELRWR